jgi:hypothetical protein
MRDKAIIAHSRMLRRTAWAQASSNWGIVRLPPRDRFACDQEPSCWRRRVSFAWIGDRHGNGSLSDRPDSGLGMSIPGTAGSGARRLGGGLLSSRMQLSGSWDGPGSRFQLERHATATQSQERSERRALFGSTNDEVGRGPSPRTAHRDHPRTSHGFARRRIAHLFCQMSCPIPDEARLSSSS